MTSTRRLTRSSKTSTVKDPARDEELTFATADQSLAAYGIPLLNAAAREP
jgi:hypothetical protein